VRSHAKAASVLVSIAILLGIVASAASAAPSATTAWVYQTSFANGEVSAGGTPAVTGVAVEGGSGNILVPDPAGEVRVYAPDALSGGTPLTTFSTFSAINIAVDRFTGAVYVNEGQFTTGFRRYLSDGAPTPTYTLDPGFAPTAEVGGDPLAIDPSTHDVLSEIGGDVVRFDPETGAVISSFPVQPSNNGKLTVGLDGTIYIGGNANQLLRFTAAGAQLSSFPLPSSEFGPESLALDPATGNVLVVVGSNLLSFSPSGEKVFEVPLQLQPGVRTHGVAVDPVEERLYVRTDDGNPYDTAGIDTYAPAPYAGVEVPAVSAITTTGFHVTTEVDPGEKAGGGVPDESTVHFEYRVVGEESWSSTPDQEVNAAGSFSADVTGLSPNLTYEVRAVASNSLTTHVTDPAKATTTAVPPATETGGATDVTETSAVLNGTINPTGLQTSYYFEYGTTTSYGARIPAGIEGVAGGGRDTKSFSRKITSLAPGTTYHFRLVATNSAGTAEGADRSFTTAAVGGIPHRVYEQATAADKQGAPIIPRVAMQASADGNGISFMKKAGSQSAAIIVRGLALRGSSDWRGDIDLDPPVNEGSGGFLVHPALAISEDFTHTLVASNRALTPGAVEEGGNLYRVDIATNTYQLIGASSEPGAFNDYTFSTNTGLLRGGAPDYSWLVFGSPKPLLSGAPKNAMYRWSESDGLEVVSVTPDGEMTSTSPVMVGNQFRTVSDDGSRIYFAGTEGSEEGVFLREGGGPAKAISVSHIAGDPATPQPANLLGVNKDGRYAFFTTRARLTDDTPNDVLNSDEGHPYRYDASDGSLEYLGINSYLNYTSMGISYDGRIAYFDAEPGLGPLTVWREGVIHTVMPESLLASNERFSPNGRYYVVSRTVEGTPNVIQVYDAETDELSCVSCLPDGTPVEGALPADTGGDTLFSNRAPRSVNDSGTVFFDTTARLVAADVNGTRDVYEYRGGTVSLISPGNRSFDAIIGDVSASGNDVFFTTAQKLVGRDNDEAIDVYDARVNGGLPAQNPPPPQECLRDDCKATPGAGPELPFGGSEALSGPENVKPEKHKKCVKGKRAKKVKGKVRCVKKHKAGKNKKGGNR
jgi:hypothetical protein